MNQPKLPYIARCSFCNQGLLRFMRCRQCAAVIAVCDECELTWRDLAAVHSNPRCPPAGTYPTCPACKTPDAGWSYLDCAKVVDASLTQYMAGEST